MLGPYLFSFPLTLFHERQPVIYVILSVKPKPDQSHVIHLALPSCFAVYCVLHTEYFMKVCAYGIYARVGQVVRFPWRIMFIIYILRFKFLFNDKLCCTDSSQKLTKGVRLDKVYKCFDCRHLLVNSNYLSLTILTMGYVVIFLQMPLNTLINILNLRAHNLLRLYVYQSD